MVTPDPLGRPDPFDRLEPFVATRDSQAVSLGRRLRRHVGATLEWLGLRRLLSTALVLGASAAGGWWLLRAPAPAVEQKLPFAAAGGTVAPGTAASGVTTSGMNHSGAGPVPTPGVDVAGGSRSGESVVVVHVAGAVARPGLVVLRPGARVADAVAAAGGAVGDADLDRVNLAAFAVDAARIYVPHEGEALASPDLGGAEGEVSTSTPLDVNTASAAELDRLPGIGPSLAAAVVAYRAANGPFRTVEALLKVPGIGPAKLEQFRALVQV